MDKKNISKSVRLTEEVFKLVDNYQGDGFNQKFENLVLDYFHSVTTRKEKLKALDKEIKAKQNTIDNIQKEILNLNSIKYAFKNLGFQLNSYIIEGGHNNG